MPQDSSTLPVVASDVAWRIGPLLVAMFLMLLFAGAGAGTARAEFGIEHFDAKVRTSDGSEEARAGIHPFDATTSISFNRITEGFQVFPDEHVRDIIVDLPAGFVGDPTSIPQCERSALLVAKCPLNTQVGVVQLLTGTWGFTNNIAVGVYNLKPPKGVIADFGFLIAGVPQHVSIGLRSDGDYGVRASLRNISSQAAQVFATNLTLWGLPSDPAHDVQRCLQPNKDTVICDNSSASDESVPHSVPALGRPLLTNPTLCGPPVETKLSARSWEHPDVWKTQSVRTSTGPTDCNSLSFRPRVTATPDVRSAQAAAGLNVDIAIPQTSDVSQRATPSLRKAVVTLPEGVALNPSSADGLVGCTDTQVKIGTLEPIGCPNGSKVGDVKIDTPLLAHPLEGAIYLGQPVPGKPYRIFLTAQSDEYGITIRLEGLLHLDPETGRITTTFDSNPQIPFGNLSIRFKGGPRGVLSSPRLCGTYSTHAELTSWAGQVATSDSPAVFDEGCDQAGRFEPSLNAGFVDPQAGGSSPFVVELSRPNGQQTLSGMDVSMPPGVLGNIASVPLCPETQAAAGTCDATSQVGVTTITSGAGTNPLAVPQAGKPRTAVYLAGPYKGAPFSLSIVVPAQAGPFDLGTVVVRAALFVDGNDAHVTVKSDPLPTILEGIPLNMQRINVTLNRPGFMVAPTSCTPMTVNATVRSEQGASVNVANRLQMANCAALPFKPTFSASTKGTLRFKQGASFRTHITSGPGQANIAKVVLTLPKELPSRLIPTINNACVLSVFDADPSKCPGDSFIGTVEAKTPVLPESLTGLAYIVAPPNDVPQVKLKLKGRGIGTGVNVDLSGDVIVDNGEGRSVITFATVPDVPITTFDLDLPAGPHSILDAPSDDLCKGPITADLTIVGQNGKRVDSKPVIKVTDCPKIKKVKILSRKVTKTGITVKVKPTHAGTLTLSGNGLKTVKKAVVRTKVTYTLSAKFSAAGRRAIGAKGLKTSPRVVYKPTNAPKALTTTSKKLTIR